MVILTGGSRLRISSGARYIYKLQTDHERGWQPRRETMEGINASFSQTLIDAPPVARGRMQSRSDPIIALGSAELGPRPWAPR